MDINKAKEAYRLYARRDDLRTSIMTMQSRLEKGIGTTTLTIPTSWIPAIINIAEDELDKVNEEIERL